MRVSAWMDSGSAFGPVPLWLSSGQAPRVKPPRTAIGNVETGALPMNFAAKLNVVAAYAAFALVCAIVFGMV